MSEISVSDLKWAMPVSAEITVHTPEDGAVIGRWLI
jgi:hypothetical protein